MVMRTFLQKLLASRTKVWLLAISLTALSLLPWFEFMAWFALVLMALVTLVKGAKQGAQLMLAMNFCVLLAAQVTQQGLLIYSLVYANTLLWFLAAVLYSSRSWSRVMQAAVFSGSLSVVAIHMVWPEVQAWWLEHLRLYLQSFANKPNMDMSTLQQRLPSLTRFATGLQITGLLFDALCKLVLARWLQAILFSRKVLAAELAQIRIDKLSALWLVLCMAGAYLGLDILFDALPPAILPCVLVGISLMHNLFLPGRVVTVMFYILLFLFFLQVGLVLMVMALTDTWLNLRARKNSAV